MVLADQLLASTSVADHEYALCVKGMILRLKGDIFESLKLFQQAMEANPRNPELLKQVRIWPLFILLVAPTPPRRIDEDTCRIFANSAKFPVHFHSSTKQVARSLFLLGRFKGSLEVYTEAVKLGGQVNPDSINLEIRLEYNLTKLVKIGPIRPLHICTCT